MKKYEWMKNDTVSIMFSAVDSRKTSRLFRVSVIFKNEEVDPDRLREAVRIAMQRYPLYLHRNTKGFFWTYLEKAEGSVAVKKPETVVLVDGWNTFKVGDLEFKKDQFSGYYYCVSAVEGATDGSMIRWSAGKHSNLSETYLDELISNNTPQPAPEVTPEETA